MMNLQSISIVVLFLFIFIKFTTAVSNPTHLTGDVSINCGSTGTFVANNGKEWIGDIKQKSSSLLQLKGSSTTSTVIHRLVSSDPVPYKTARISRTQFSYVFQVSPGQKILRLHFNPTSYKGFKGFMDLFTVEAGPFTLLGNFSASLTADALGVDSLVKEFCLNIQEHNKINIFFSPESSPSSNTYAFINGIQIFSLPASVSYFEGGDVGVQLVGEKSLVYFDYNTALEIVHRVEMNSFMPAGDSDFPKWESRNANTRNNNTWKMPVDVGFKYLIRVHLSKVGLKIVRSGHNMFEVLINKMIVQSNIDAAKGKDGTNIPLHRDYMVLVRGNKNEGKRYIYISLKSYDELLDVHAFFSGFEIFKLSNSINSLASPNPLPLARDTPSQTVQTLFYVLWQRNGIATLAVAIISLVCIVVYKLLEIREANIIEDENKPKPKPSPSPSPSARAGRICRHFSLDEIQLATSNFSDALVIGSGGFGKVYKGHIDTDQTTVAIKRLKSSSKQGAHEFLTEIETLSELRHVNLVSLIGYCNEKREMILVYEYMPCGTLADQIYKLASENNSCFSLTWKQRLDICIGAGRGLDYLHTGHGVIHRDVKASNILLDENFIAKVSDFGLAKLENKSKLKTHISTNVKGTFGYLDPNYYRTRKLTRKSDTYAFGVVLLEVLCGRSAVNVMVPGEERILSMWARDKINKGEVDQIVAPSLREEISPNSLTTFVEVAQRCLSDELKERPTMSQVVSQLELAVEQQETQQPFERAAAGVSDNNHCPNNDKDDDLSSVQTGQPTTSSTNVQNLTPPLKEQTKDKMASAQLPSAGTKHVRSAPGRKLPLRWPWEAFWKRPKPSEEKDLSSSEEVRWHLLRHFRFDEIKTATNDFNDNLIIGRGGHGNMYKGFIGDDAYAVAIKRLKPRSMDKALTEIGTLPNVMHRNLISPIGYCKKKDEIMIVYEYMARGNLHQHLYNRASPPLTWKQRLQICIGAARGLDYLHENSIVHSDVSSANILLDEKWVVKVSDYKLQTLARPGEPNTHISTVVVGTLGYLDPEFLMGQELTEKSDVYSFGVVLLEVLCARPPVIFKLQEEQVSLAEWAELCYRNGTLEHIVDSHLDGQIAPKCLSKFVETAVTCIKHNQTDRPAMSDVIRSLESVMQLQEAADAGQGIASLH